MPLITKPTAGYDRNPAQFMLQVYITETSWVVRMIYVMASNLKDRPNSVTD